MAIENLNIECKCASCFCRRVYALSNFRGRSSLKEKKTMTSLRRTSTHPEVDRRREYAVHPTYDILYWGALLCFFEGGWGRVGGPHPRGAPKWSIRMCRMTCRSRLVSSSWPLIERMSWLAPSETAQLQAKTAAVGASICTICYPNSQPSNDPFWKLGVGGLHLEKDGSKERKKIAEEWSVTVHRR